jgi:hypothetical protein
MYRLLQLIPALENRSNMTRIQVSLSRRLGVICPDRFPGIAVFAHLPVQMPGGDIYVLAGLHQRITIYVVAPQLTQVNRVDLHDAVVERAVCIEVHRIGPIVGFLPRNRAQNHRIDTLVGSRVVETIGPGEWRSKCEGDASGDGNQRAAAEQRTMNGIAHDGLSLKNVPANWKLETFDSTGMTMERSLAIKQT